MTRMCSSQSIHTEHQASAHKGVRHTHGGCVTPPTGSAAGVEKGTHSGRATMQCQSGQVCGGKRGYSIMQSPLPNWQTPYVVACTGTPAFQSAEAGSQA